MQLSNAHAFYIGISRVLFLHHAQKRAEMAPLGQREPKAQPRLEGRDLPGSKGIAEENLRQNDPVVHVGKAKC